MGCIAAPSWYPPADGGGGLGDKRQGGSGGGLGRRGDEAAGLGEGREVGRDAPRGACWCHEAGRGGGSDGGDAYWNLGAAACVRPWGQTWHPSTSCVHACMLVPHRCCPSWQCWSGTWRTWRRRWVGVGRAAAGRPNGPSSSSSAGRATGGRGRGAVWGGEEVAGAGRGLLLPGASGASSFPAATRLQQRVPQPGAALHGSVDASGSAFDQFM